jgi:hypothetical protein
VTATGKPYWPASLTLVGRGLYVAALQTRRVVGTRCNRAPTPTKRKLARVWDACRLNLSFVMTLSGGVVHGFDNRFFYRHVMLLSSGSLEIFRVNGKGAAAWKAWWFRCGLSPLIPKAGLNNKRIRLASGGAMAYLLRFALTDKVFDSHAFW